MEDLQLDGWLTQKLVLRTWNIRKAKAACPIAVGAGQGWFTAAEDVKLASANQFQLT